ncbi:MAG TPA: MgtC/SapB family protein [Polyangiales bacterium]
MQTDLELLLRIAVAGALGAVIGFERNWHHRPAGLRTHMVVAIASATFMVVSYGFHTPGGQTVDSLAKVDVSRIASQVVSGAGFIAGGAILRSGPTVQGLTTAAGLWLVTAIGLAAGAGMFVVASSVTALGMAALWLMRKVEGGGQLREQGQVSLEIAGDASLTELRQLIEGSQTRVVSHDYTRRFGASETQVTFLISHGDSFDPDKLIDRLRAAPNLRSVRVEKLT